MKERGGWKESFLFTKIVKRGGKRSIYVVAPLKDGSQIFICTPYFFTGQKYNQVSLGAKK
jgi:hypothetical protein